MFRARASVPAFNPLAWPVLSLLAACSLVLCACEAKQSWMGVGLALAADAGASAAAAPTAQAPSAGATARRPVSPLAPGAASASPPAPGLLGGPPAAAVVAVPEGAAAVRRPTLFLEKRFEPRQRAFSFFVPKGWLVEGGMFSVDPSKANGPGNSVDTKCDLTVKKDAEASVMVRWLPSWNYADFSRGRTFALSRGLFPVGSRYMGMQVRPMPGTRAFLLAELRKRRPGATGVKVLSYSELPEVAAGLGKALASTNAILRRTGLPPLRAFPGALAVEYGERGRRYREAMFTVLVDNRGAAASWSNEGTLAVRAPADEAELWRPALDVIRSSAQLNPEWLRRYKKASAERARLALETTRHLARVDREITENRRKTHADIRHEQYLFLTGQEEYVNPYNGEVERDTNEYKHRWTTFGGAKILSDEESYDPNRVRELSGVEWKKTAARPR